MMNDFPQVWIGSLALTPQGMLETHQREMAYDDWLEFGKKLFELKQAIQWAIGDWINYGEAAYGEKYAQALDITEVSFRTVQNYAWLSKAFPISRRREALSWSHHEAVKSIKDETEQDALLDIAESQQMGRDELREIVKKYKNPDGLLVVGSPYRVIEGAIGWNNKFVPNDNENLEPGKAILHLYEGDE